MSVLAESTMDLSVVDTKTPAQTATDYISDDGNKVSFGADYQKSSFGSESGTHIEIDSDSFELMDGDDAKIRIAGEGNPKTYGIEIFDELSSSVFMSDGIHSSKRTVGSSDLSPSGLRVYDSYTDGFALEASKNELSVIKRETNGGIDWDQEIIIVGKTVVDTDGVRTTGDVSADGSVTGKINANFAYTPHTLLSSQSIGAESYSENVLEITKSGGWYPLAVAQWNSTTRYWSLNRCYLTNQQVGKATLNWMVANHHSSAHSASMTVQVLWCKA